MKTYDQLTETEQAAAVAFFSQEGGNETRARVLAQSVYYASPGERVIALPIASMPPTELTDATDS